MQNKWDKLTEEFIKTYHVAPTTGHVETEINEYMTGRDKKILKKILSEYHKFDNALDLGCGDGRLTFFLVNFSKKVTAIDISKKMIQLARKKGSKGIDFLCGDIRKLKLKRNYFDMILLSGVFSSLETEALDKIVNVLNTGLKDNGIVIFIDNVLKKSNEKKIPININGKEFGFVYLRNRKFYINLFAKRRFQLLLKKQIYYGLKPIKISSSILKTKSKRSITYKLLAKIFLSTSYLLEILKFLSSPEEREELYVFQKIR